MCAAFGTAAALVAVSFWHALVGGADVAGQTIGFGAAPHAPLAFADGSAGAVAVIVARHALVGGADEAGAAVGVVCAGDTPAGDAMAAATRSGGAALKLRLGQNHNRHCTDPTLATLKSKHNFKRLRSYIFSVR